MKARMSAGQEISRNKETEITIYALFFFFFLRSSSMRKSERYVQDQNHSIAGYMCKLKRDEEAEDIEDTGKKQRNKIRS